MAQEFIDAAGNIWRKDADGNPVFVRGPETQGVREVLGADPIRQRREERAEETASRSAAASERAAEAANRQAAASERQAADQQYGNAFQLRKQYDDLPPVKEYRVAISQLATGLKTADNATGDNALIYAYAKTMDPASVVRESEMGMAASGQSIFDTVAANLKKQFGIEGGGQLSPQVRSRLRREMINKATELNRIYNAQRDRFREDAKAFGFDPERIIGTHDGAPYRPILSEYTKRQKPTSEPLGEGEFVRDGQRWFRDPQTGEETPVVLGGSEAKPENAADDKAGDYEQSALSQGLSGINEGLAGIVGAPVDLATAGLNLIPRGINALANTDLPTINNPILGSQWLKNQMEALGSIGAPAATPGMQMVRRVGESVGAALPVAGFAGNLARAGGQVLAGAGGGLGAAGAQQMFPGNPWAEVAGELAGSGLTGTGLVKAAQRNATRQMEAGIPTIPELQDQASNLYRAAESRGVVANPQQTQDLADNMRQALQNEGRVSPTGRISEVYPKAREAMQLAEDYAGNTMTPTQIDTLRKVAADGLTSPERAERRLGRILTDAIDQWADPMAPELREARNVASRYLTAQQLERARELAGAQASQFTGSGFENALRTQYRALDRADIKDTANFPPAVSDAIQTVSRGTPASNAARALGRLYPTGPVSLGLGSGIPGIMAGLATGSPVVGGAAVAGATGLGAIGRAAATRMGIRAADRAELTARHGAALPEIPALTPETMQNIGALATAESAKYLPSQAVEDGAGSDQQGNYAPNPLAGAESQQPLSPTASATTALLSTRTGQAALTKALLERTKPFRGLGLWMTESPTGLPRFIPQQ